MHRPTECRGVDVLIQSLGDRNACAVQQLERVHASAAGVRLVDVLLVVTITNSLTVKPDT